MVDSWAIGNRKGRSGFEPDENCFRAMGEVVSGRSHPVRIFLTILRITHSISMMSLESSLNDNLPTD